MHYRMRTTNSANTFLISNHGFSKTKPNYLRHRHTSTFPLEATVDLVSLVNLHQLLSSNFAARCNTMDHMTQCDTYRPLQHKQVRLGQSSLRMGWAVRAARSPQTQR